MAKSAAKAPSTSTATKGQQQCGLVMPISSLDGYSEQHWADVRAILAEALGAVGFEANLVSEADDVGVIHKRIIQNLYDNPVVVCDVSGKNPNVMFELGMRLAFDKPTIIIKDDQTSYSFDTSPIDHLAYPRDLRYAKIVDFKTKLGEKVKKTYEAAQKNDPQYSTFLKHFGPFTVAKLETTEVSNQEFILEQVREELREVRRLATRRDLIERGIAGAQGRSYVVEPLWHGEAQKRGQITESTLLRDGRLLQGSGPPVFRIEGGMRRWVPNEQTFNKMGLDWNAILKVSDDLLETIPRGEDYPSL